MYKVLFKHCLAWLSDFLRSICDNGNQFCVFQEYIRAVKVIFSDCSEKTSWTDPNSERLERLLLEVGVEVMFRGCGWSYVWREWAPHALLQIRIQPCGGFKGFTEVQQRIRTEAKSTDSEPCEWLSCVGSWQYPQLKQYSKNSKVIWHL